MQTPREKFQGLLKKLFQFDCAELDFGIYRIMNQKRAIIERFIEKDLLEAVTAELSSGALAQESSFAQQLKEMAEKVRETFGEDSLDAEGNLLKGQDLALGKEYLALRERAAKPKSQPELEAEIFNHLYAFFSRYYDDGDFMSLRRYSKRDKYAIPYNGEEVHLHWANSDQYYIKTAENFTDYSYKHGGWTVQFKLRNAEVEQNNVKGAKRFFLPRLADVGLEPATRTLTIPFEYRPLTPQEEITFKSKPQETILAEAAQKIVATAKPNTDALAALLREKRKDTDGNPVSLLDHHLRVYTRKNTSDFFIHKDLGGFLDRELDFYLKNEVLNVDELEAGGEARVESWFQILRAMKAIGRKIIAFVAQIENFQKRLFEKKKFVTEVHYCVTLDRVPEELYPEIAKNKAQIAEWKRLFHIHEIEKDTTQPGFSDPLTVGFLKAHSNLVLDTRFFSGQFIDTLLSSKSFAQLSTALDGQIIWSENRQALELLKSSLRDSMDIFYIDPPYNTGSDDFNYKDNYQHSTWLAMIEDRARIAKILLRDSGLLLVSINEIEMHNLIALLDRVFGEGKFRAHLVWNTEGNIDNQSRIKGNHEYVLLYAKRDAAFVAPEVIDPNIPSDSKLFNETIANSITKNGPANPPSTVTLPKGFPVDFDEGTIEPGTTEWPKLSCRVKVKGGSTLNTVNATTGWSSRALLDDFIANGCKPIKDAKGNETWFKLYATGAIYIYKKRPGNQSHVLSVIRNVGTVKQMSGTLAEMGFAFDYPKPIKLIEYLNQFANDEDSIHGDFFAGSGTTAHAVMNINQSKKQRRKYLLVDAGDVFQSVLKPRLQKAIYSKDWKDGKPVSRQGSSHVFKYLRLESYEDVLDNITFLAADEQTML